jgi:hypothetical protein
MATAVLGAEKLAEPTEQDFLGNTLENHINLYVIDAWKNFQKNNDVISIVDVDETGNNCLSIVFLND